MQETGRKKVQPQQFVVEFIFVCYVFFLCWSQTIIYSGFIAVVSDGVISR